MALMGFDRPLRPEWIYETLRLIEPNARPEEYYNVYDRIAVELTGKDGRRKTRTILFRTFLFSFQQRTNLIQDNPLLQLCKTHDLAFCKPVLLVKMLSDYTILRHFAQQFQRLFDPTQLVSTSALTGRMTEAFGDTEIIRRSTRSFLKTLTDFGILQPDNVTTFRQLPRSNLNPEQVAAILNVIAASQHTHQIDLLRFDRSLFAFYQQPDLNAVAHQFHPQRWEYIKGVDRSLLML